MSTILSDMLLFGGEGGGSSDVYAAIKVTYPFGSTCTATNGITTLTASGTSGLYIFGIPEPASTPETWTVSCTDGTNSKSTTVNISEYGQIEDITLSYLTIYGVSWDGTSTTAWTRTDASANFADPVPYVSGTSSYGSPFDNLYPWKDMVRVTDSAAGEMVKIPKFWYKLTQNGSGMSIQIADAATEGFSVCPACMNRGDGNGEHDYILIGRYHCDSTYKSTTGVKPMASKTRSAFRTGIQGLGTGVYMMDWATRFTIWLLYLVEFANWDSQVKIGYGCGNNSVGNMGYTDSMPYHTGTTQALRSSFGYGTQYRYIEGLWDNILDWIDGCYNSSNGLMLILNPTKFSDSTNGTSIGIPGTGTTSPARFPKGFSVTNVNGMFPAFIPNAGGGSNTTYSSDEWYFSTSSPCICVGGTYESYLNYGLFLCYCDSTSFTHAGVGSRPMKFP